MIELANSLNASGLATSLYDDGRRSRNTGQIRDQESGEDFFNARYFTAPLGRFNSPDPMNAGASLLSSQSWNGYGYVLGNPLALVDPSGRDAQCGPNATWSGEGCWGGTSGGQASAPSYYTSYQVTASNGMAVTTGSSLGTSSTDIAAGLATYLNNVRYGGFGGGPASGWGWVSGDDPLAVLAFVRLSNATQAVPGAAVAAGQMLSASACAGLFNGLPFKQSGLNLLADPFIQFGTGADPRGNLAVTRRSGGEAIISFMLQAAPEVGTNGAFVSSSGPFSAPNINSLAGGHTVIHELIHAGISIYGMQAPSQGPFVKWTQYDGGVDAAQGINNSIVNSSCSGGSQ